MQHPFVSFFLVGVQFTTLLYLILTSPFTLSSWFIFVLFVGGVILGLSAVLAMRRNRWNITPDVHEKSLLVTTGPYSVIRHPMYTAVIMVAISLFLEIPNSNRLIALLILIIILNIKYRYEEYLLVQAFPETYPAYLIRTKALIPFVY
ncbi:MAG TPA: isoprenylcysteine carboxylmethyltransferase family protein [Patescibacteria group bacterium]|nr:isoprenylcysteine carboxylmethyltransferase family protein [Patescibacteria group bacterium]